MLRWLWQKQKKLKEKKKNNDGFTLLEIIIAVAILGLVSTPIIAALIQTAKINSMARRLQKGTDLAQNLMEGIREYTMTQVVQQCITAGEEGNLKIIYSSLIDYEPTGYVYLNTSNFEEQLIKKANVNDDVIYGEIDDSRYDAESFYAAGGDTYKFAFIDIAYNNSSFDAVITFERPVETAENNGGGGGVVLPQKEEIKKNYHIYNVKITIYESFNGSHFLEQNKITTLTGAIQNK